MSFTAGQAPLPGTPSRLGTGGSSLNMTAVIRAVDLETKSVDKRGASTALRSHGHRGDVVDSKQQPAQKPVQAPASLEASTETYTKLTSSLRRNSDYTLSFALIGVLCMMVQNELAWVWNTEAGYGSFCPSDTPDCSSDVKRARAAMFPVTEGLVVLNALRAVITFTTLVCLYFCYKFYATRLVVMKNKNLLPQSATLLGSGLRWPFLFESVGLAIHVFPGIDGVSSDPSLYLWMNLLMFGRLFLMLRVVRYHSPLLSSNGRFIGALTNVEFNASFILKTALKQNPVAFMTVCLVTLFVSAGYSIRLIDSLMCVARVELNCEPISFWDAQWLLAITILTVGYGDFVPHSDGARFVALVGGLTGTMITAVTIALTTSYLNLSRSESRVVTFLRKDALKRMLQLAGARALQAFYRYYSVESGRKSKKRRAERHLYSALARFRAARRYVLSHDPVTPQDRQISLLETMEVNVDDMKAHLELLGGYLIGVPDMVPGLQTEAPAAAAAPVDTTASAGLAVIHDAPDAGAADTYGASGAAFGPVTAGGGGGGGRGGASGGDGGGGGGNSGAHTDGRGSRVVTPVGVDGLRRRKRRDSFVSNGDWVTDIRDTMTIMTERLSVLAADMEDLQAAVTRSTKVTYARLDKLEAAVVRLSTLAGTQAHVGIGDGESVRSLRR